MSEKIFISYLLSRFTYKNTGEIKTCISNFKHTSHSLGVVRHCTTSAWKLEYNGGGTLIVVIMERHIIYKHLGVSKLNGLSRIIKHCCCCLFLSNIGCCCLFLSNIGCCCLFLKEFRLTLVLILYIMQTDCK